LAQLVRRLKRRADAVKEHSQVSQALGLDSDEDGEN
jgi:hypothetical protein